MSSDHPNPPSTTNKEEASNTPSHTSISNTATTKTTTPQQQQQDQQSQNDIKSKQLMDLQSNANSASLSSSNIQQQQQAQKSKTNENELVDDKKTTTATMSLTTTTTPMSPTTTPTTPTPTATNNNNNNNNNNRNNNSNRPASPTSAAVLAYLKKRGLGTAVLELTKNLKEQTHADTEKEQNKKRKIIDIDDPPSSSEDNTNLVPNENEHSNENVEGIEMDNDRARDARTALTSSTGGGIGYDLDGAPNVISFGQFGTIPRNDTTSGTCKDVDKEDEKEVKWEEKRGRLEGKQYIECFTTFLTYVLSLNAGDSTPKKNKEDDIVLPTVEEVIRRMEENTADNNEELFEKGESIFWNELSCNVIRNLRSTQILSSSNTKTTNRNNNINPTSSTNTNLKTELFSLSFPLYVHIYCELLELGLEHDASCFYHAFVHIFVPLYSNELWDLKRCTSTKQIVELNTAILQNSEGHSELRALGTKIDTLKQQQGADGDTATTATATISTTAKVIQPKESNLSKQSSSSHQIEIQISNYTKKISQHKSMMEKNLAQVLSQYPFLKRARSLKWEIRLSTCSMDILQQFFTLHHIDLLCLNTLLQSRCHVMVEKNGLKPCIRGFIPPCVFREGSDCVKKNKILWAAPIHPNNRSAIQDGDEASMGQFRFRNLPYPKFFYSNKKEKEEKVDEQEDDLVKQEKGDNDEDVVEFNRALLIHGFRRLESLEVKRDYESGMRTPASATNDITKQQAQAPLSSCVANPLQPSIFMSTLCSSRSSTKNDTKSASSKGFPTSLDSTASTSTTTLPSSNYLDFLPSDFHITCAKLSPGDGRRIAVGCEDSGIRIMSVDGGTTHAFSDQDDCTGRNHTANNTATSKAWNNLNEPLCILLGHKEGYPIFDVSWCRDGRTLLSAGGDGTVRLWDTLAIGPYARNSVKFTPGKGTKYTSPTPIPPSSDPNIAPTSHLTTTQHLPSSSNLVDVNAAQLAVYRSHALHTPVYSVTMAPCGYYFLSTGADGTARIWLTDYPLKPFRLFLSSQDQHTSKTNMSNNAVHCGAWHPNCNYIFTGSDDSIVRMFDVHSGRCVRILSGLQQQNRNNCKSSIHNIAVCPSGRYVVASTGMTFAMWDLASGRLIHLFDCNNSTTNNNNGYYNNNNNYTNTNYSDGEIYTMAYSACGTTLATGGTDACIQLWDVRGGSATTSKKDNSFAISNSYNNNPYLYKTKQTMLLDLQFTKRNLLMAVGKYVS